MNKLENLSYSTIYEHFLTLIMIQYLHINQINFMLDIDTDIQLKILH